jgi:two-component system nitrate/nitrite response regulator NarL
LNADRAFLGDNMSKVRLLISDQNQLVREGIARILNSSKMEVVGEMRSLMEVLEALRGNQIDANLMLADPSSDSELQFEAMTHIRQEFPGLRIVILTNQLATSWLDRAIGAGAAGFLPKDMSGDALRFSLELVLLGERIFPTIRSVLEADTARAQPATNHAPARAAESIPLSRRESQILQCLVDGLPNKTIARNLDMAEATVKVHLKSILRKLNVQNRTQAAIWGMNHPAQIRDDSEATGETTAFHERIKHV